MPAIILNKSKITPSPSAIENLKGLETKTFISFAEHCPTNHPLCKQNNSAMAQIGSLQGHGLCSIKDYNKYEVSCNNCKENLATIYAKNETLEDWRRARYLSWHDKKNWYGALGLNIDLTTSEIRFECTCQPGIRKDIDSISIKEVNKV